MLTPGLQLGTGLQPTNPIPTDSWAGPYASIAEANATVPSAVRFEGREVIIWDGIRAKIYGWYVGIGDGDLEESAGGGSATPGEGMGLDGSGHIALGADFGSDIPITTARYVTLAAGSQVNFATAGDGIGILGIINDGTISGVQIQANDLVGGIDYFSLVLDYGNGAVFSDNRPTKIGIVYENDYSASFTARSLVDKEYVDNAVASGGAFWPLDGAASLTGDVTIDMATFGVSMTGNGPSSSFYVEVVDGDVTVTSEIVGSGITLSRYDSVLDSNQKIEFDDQNVVIEAGLQANGGASVRLENGNGTPDPGIYLEAYDSGSVNVFSIALTALTATISSTYATFAGLQYDADYSANFTARSLVDKEYVDNVVIGGGLFIFESGLTNTAGTVRLGGILTQDVSIDGTTNGHYINMSGTSMSLTTTDETTFSAETTMGSVASAYRRFSLDSSVSGGMDIITAGAANVQLYSSDSIAGFEANISLMGTAGEIHIGQSDGTVFINIGNIDGTDYSYISTYGVNKNIEISTGNNTTGHVNINLFEDSFTITGTHPTFAGARYAADYSTNFTARSLVDKEYVDNVVIGGGLFIFEDGLTNTAGTITLGGTINTSIVFDDIRATPTGLEYNADYSATFVDRSLVDKAYVDANLLIGSTSTLGSETWLGNLAGDGATGYTGNVFIGDGAGTNATGTYFTFVGSTAGGGGLVGFNVVGVGVSAGYGAINAQYSVFVGDNAGYQATNAVRSIFIGGSAGLNDTVDNTGGGSSILIGYQSSTGGFSDSIAIGAGATNTMTNQFMVSSQYTNWQIAGVDYVMPNSSSVGVLTNDGSGNLSWAPGGGGSGWPLTGSASLTGDVTIDGGSGPYSVEIGTTTNRLREFNVHVLDNNETNLEITDDGAVIQFNNNTTNQVSILQLSGNAGGILFKDGASSTLMGIAGSFDGSGLSGATGLEFYYLAGGGAIGSTLILGPQAFVTGNENNFEGLQYDQDYSANYSNRSLVDKEYVDNAVAGGGGGGGHIIQNAGSPLPQRANLNITGGLKAVDDSGNDATVISLGNSLIEDTLISGNNVYSIEFQGLISFNTSMYMPGGGSTQHQITSNNIQTNITADPGQFSYWNISQASDAGISFGISLSKTGATPHALIFDASNMATKGGFTITTVDEVDNSVRGALILNRSVSDLLTPTDTTGLGVKIEFQVEIPGSAIAENAGISYVLTNAPDNTDVTGKYVFSLNAGGAGGYNTGTDILEIDQFGARYMADYSTNYTARSLVDKEYVDNVVIGGGLFIFESGLNASAGTVRLGGALTQNADIPGAGFDVIFGNSGSKLGNFNIAAATQLDALIGDAATDFSELSMTENAATLTASNNTTFQLAQFALAIDTTGSYITLTATGNQANGNSAAINIYTNYGGTNPDGKIEVVANSASFAGIEYSANFSANFTARSLVDKAYVDNVVIGGGLFIFENGLTNTAGTITLGGALNQDTTVDGINTYLMAFENLTNFRVQADISGGRNARFGLDDGGGYSYMRNDNAGFTQSGQFRVGLDYVYFYANNDPNNVTVEINPTGMTVEGTGTFAGITYLSDYSANYTNRSLVDKEYVDNAIAGGGDFWPLGGNAVFTGDIQLNGPGTGLYGIIINNVNLFQTNTINPAGDSASMSVNSGAFGAQFSIGANSAGGDGFSISYGQAAGFGDIQSLFDGNLHARLRFAESLVTLSTHTSGVTIKMGVNVDQILDPATWWSIGDGFMQVISYSPTFAGITYSDDFSANYTNRSLVDKEYVDSVAGGGGFTFENGLTESGGIVRLGGTLDQGNTLLVVTNDGVSYRQFTLTASTSTMQSVYIVDDVAGSYTRFGGGTNGSAGSAYLVFDIDGISGPANTVEFADNRTIPKGLEYAADYSAGYTDRSLVDKEWVLNQIVSGTIPAPQNDDKDLTPTVTSGDEASTGLTITNVPKGLLIVIVDGVAFRVGDGVKTKDCYFSGDGGTTARTLASIVAGDELYWNGVIAGADLAVTNKIDFYYI